MSTYGVMQERIARELRRNGLATEIREAIQEAILLEEIAPYFFNQARATSQTAAGQPRYQVPNDFQVMRSLKVRNGDNWQVIEPVTYEEIEWSDANGSDTAIPRIYAIWDQRFRLYPIPDAIYSLELAYTQSLSALTDDDSTNVWMTDGEPLIRYMAKAIILRNLIQGPEAEAAAATQEALAQRARDRLRIESTRRTATGTLRGWSY